jgi:hypothetical protein
MTTDGCWVKSYNGFSGLNMTARIGTIDYAKVQAISIAKSREPVPIYTECAPKPTKESYAGTLIFEKFYYPQPISIFDVELFRSDEDGQTDSMYIIGAEILMDGFAWDPNKMFEINTQYTYIAKKIIPWKNLDG